MELLGQGCSGSLGRLGTADSEEEQRVEDILWYLEVSTGSHSCTRLWTKCLLSGGEPDMALALMELRGWRGCQR